MLGSRLPRLTSRLSSKLRASSGVVSLSPGRRMGQASGNGAQRQATPSTSPATRRGVAVAAEPQTASPSVPSVYVEGQDPDVLKLQEHQKTAARPSAAEDAQTLIKMARHGTLCTVSTSKDTAGFPFGSVVEYAADEQGRPIFATSTLSPHTADLAQDGRVSLTVTAPGFRGLQDARFTLTAKVAPISDAERPAAREAFLKKYPDAFWVDFGDFRWFRCAQCACAPAARRTRLTRPPLSPLRFKYSLRA